MSRWSKGRGQVAVPLETLIREKENVNRPSASRSAGTVGKWGVTSFTSIRNSYGVSSLSSYSPREESADCSPQSGEYPLTPTVIVPDPPKLKKFFKSRNAAPDNTPKSPQQELSQQYMGALSREVSKDSEIKISGKKIKSKKEELIKTKPEKHKNSNKSKSLTKSTKTLSEKLKVNPNKRSSTRTKNKVVNYNDEVDDEEQKRQISKKPVDEITTKIQSPVKETQKNFGDHPPIVLRISKGTSRLISTDSEDITFSPPHQDKKVLGALSSTAELLAVLTDNAIASEEIPPLPHVVQNLETELKSSVISIETDQLQLKPDSIKIKIKSLPLTSDITVKDYIPPGTHKTHHQHKRKVEIQKIETTYNSPVISSRITRASRQQQNKAAKCPSPLPGTDNYELYRTLASPSDKDFDSLSSVLGTSISSKETTFIAGIPEDSRVIHSRGSSDFDTSQSSIVVAPTSDINVPVEKTIFASESDNKDINSPLLIDQVNTKVNISKKTKRIKRVVKSSQSDLNISLLMTKEGRVTRNNNNNNNNSNNKNGVSQETIPCKPAIRSYTRKRKNTHPTEVDQFSNSDIALKSPSSNTTNRTEISINFDHNSLPTTLQLSNNYSSSLSNNISEIETINEYKIKNKFKKSWYKQDVHSDDNSSQEKNNIRDLSINNLNDKTLDIPIENQIELPIVENQQNNDKPIVKLVITKKKGSIFKSRALIADQESNKKRHIYKHKWDDYTKDKVVNSSDVAKSSNVDEFFDDFNDETSSFTTMTRPSLKMNEEEPVDSSNYDKKIKTFVTVRNVKKAHQIQEIGEFQEMDDDVEYLLDALQPHNPLSTRCLSAIQLAQKCMTPAFRMHVRAHGTVTKFFKALHDATKDQSLGLCTATVMFVLSQDNLNMDLDKDSLGLMLNLLESDVSHNNVLEDCGLNKEQLQRNLKKVRELCEEIKGQGKAAHLNLDNITVGTLAMETLLSLTSKRAGEWFKEELRELGGLEHIINTICECCRQISDYVVHWTDILLEKLRKIERCLRVLENVTQINEQNQNYILSYNNGHAVNTLVKLYKLCDTEIALYPTNENTPKENPGVVIREALVPTLKVLINLTHPFNEKAIGSIILGEKCELFDSSLHLLLQASNYVPEQCIFELSILVLLLLINLTMHTIQNRRLIIEANVQTDFGNKFVKVPAIKALVEYFYSCEEMASQAEQNTDAILDNPNKRENKPQSQEEVQETVTKLLKKAGNHMEHTMLASYDCILIGQLVMGSDENEKRIRQYLHTNSFKDMITVLDKYYNFMNLTASSEAAVVAHIKATKKMIEHLKQRDSHSNNDDEDDNIDNLVNTQKSKRTDDLTINSYGSASSYNQR